jgi:GntR family transcriptional repressor for pyruvate dehydrogenase complex
MATGKSNKKTEPAFDDLFKAEKIESAVDRVINAIKEALLSEKLLPGERLPSESELSERLSISRGSIREAMKILSAFGIVEVKRGDGTYIAKSEHKAVFDPLLFSLILSKANRKEFAELRELMEVAIVKLIIENAEDEDLKNIEETINDMESRAIKGSDNQPEHLIQFEIDFHHSLGQATKNRLIEKIYNFVMEFFLPSIKDNIKREGDKGITAFNDHKKIHHSLANRDIEEAIRSIHRSIKEWKTVFTSKPTE